MSSIKIYDKNTIHTLEGKEKDYLLPLLVEGVQKYISNVKTELKVLTIDHLVLPLTINEAEYENAYICSPYTHYITGAAEETKQLKSPLLKWLLKSFLYGLGSFFKRGKINKVVIVNNWLFSTNLYPQMSLEQIEAITRYLVASYPHHAILFRSLDTCANQYLLNHLKQQAYHAILSRVVFFFDPTSKQSRMENADLALMKKSPYLLSAGCLENAQRIAQLYHALYIQKYSTHSPHYNDKFISLLMKSGRFKIKVLKLNGQIDGVCGYYESNEVLTAPLFGYDLSKPQSYGLYRILSCEVMKESREQMLRLNKSAGSAHFKLLRKAKPYLEFNAVYTDHLSFFRRFPWMLLKGIANGIGIPLLKNLTNEKNTSEAVKNKETKPSFTRNLETEIDDVSPREPKI